MTTPRYYGLPPSLRAVTGSNGLVTVTWPRPFTTPPVVTVTLENESTTLGAFADLLKGSITTTSATIRAWRLQTLTSGLLGIGGGGNPALPYAGATVHITPRGDLA